MRREESINRSMMRPMSDDMGAVLADRIIRGENPRDVLEMYVDELTTTAGVGSGTDTALGGPPAYKVQKQQRKKALVRFKNFKGKLKKEGKYTTDKKALSLFMSETGLARAPREVRNRLRHNVREAGYKV